MKLTYTWHSVIVGRGPICGGDCHASGMSVNLTLVSVFQKAEADAQCPAEVLTRDVAAG